MMTEWVLFDKNYDYPKQWHDVLLPDNTVVNWCWPNAGLMCETTGELRTWNIDAGVKVRIGQSPIDKLTSLVGEDNIKVFQRSRNPVRQSVIVLDGNSYDEWKCEPERTQQDLDSMDRAEAKRQRKAAKRALLRRDKR